MAHHGELAMLYASINVALTSALDQGDEHGFAHLHWLNEVSIQEHLEHARAHVENICAGNVAELDNAICRLAMAKTILIQAQMIKEQGS